MQGRPEVAVVRLGHRPGRDDRMTTHVALTARALGADRVVLEPAATQAAETARDITDRFGGPFIVEQTESATALVRDWDGAVVHLTMYGQNLQDVVTECRNVHAAGPLLIVVGAEKVPYEVYDEADFNVGVTNQPHSEVAALGVFLDRLFEGAELEQSWADAAQRVVPQETGKRVVDRADEPASTDGHDETG
jgi:tRNA (cytidine56-2'-O)-methyltransferase